MMKDSPLVDCSGFQKYLAMAECDILFLFDCCYATAIGNGVAKFSEPQMRGVELGVILASLSLQQLLRSCEQKRTVSVFSNFGQTSPAKKAKTSIN